MRLVMRAMSNDGAKLLEAARGLRAEILAVRDNIESEEQWRAFIDRCLSEWHRMFGTCPPLYGKNLNDYLSNFTTV